MVLMLALLADDDIDRGAKIPLGRHIQLVVAGGKDEREASVSGGCCAAGTFAFDRDTDIGNRRPRSSVDVPANQAARGEKNFVHHVNFSNRSLMATESAGRIGRGAKARMHG